MKKARLIITGAVFFALSAACWFLPDREFSQSERRLLAEPPEISAENILNGQFESEFEKYTADQFPLREQFRSLKALSEYGLFLKKDSNDIYIKDGHAAALLYPYSEESVSHAAEVFRKVYEKYIEGTGSKVYASVIPDKGFFMAGKGYPTIDYERMFSAIEEKMDYADYVDISGSLSIDDYYRTDLHWRQEKILDVAEKLGDAMETDLSGLGQVKEVTASDSFCGVYGGQSALPLKKESLIYMTSPELEECLTFNFETNQEGRVYDMDGLEGRDPYDIFMSGASALITAENPANGETGRELIIFRDSFGSSLAPLLLTGYSKITLVDLRYIKSEYLDQFIEFKGQDILFIYGTALLNDSYTLQ